MIAAVRRERSKIASPVAFENSPTSTAARADRRIGRCDCQYQAVATNAPANAARPSDLAMWPAAFGGIMDGVALPRALGAESTGFGGDAGSGLGASGSNGTATELPDILTGAMN